jgi:hypothetical protein
MSPRHSGYGPRARQGVANHDHGQGFKVLATRNPGGCPGTRHPTRGGWRSEGAMDR